MIASLPMYDLPQLQAANDALWILVRDALGYGPRALTRDRDLWQTWLDPDLLLGQTCNLPYRLRMQGQVQLLGCPDYGLEGCPPGHYNSVLVARGDDPRNLTDLLRARVLINQEHSQSGFAALLNHAEALGITPNITGQSGGHALSVAAMAQGEADLACVDAHSWRLTCRYNPQAATLRVLDRTAPTPATPFICGLNTDAHAVRRALQQAIAALPEPHRSTLNLQALVPITEAQIMAFPIPKAVPRAA